MVLILFISILSCLLAMCLLLSTCLTSYNCVHCLYLRLYTWQISSCLEWNQVIILVYILLCIITLDSCWLIVQANGANPSLKQVEALAFLGLCCILCLAGCFSGPLDTRLASEIWSFSLDRYCRCLTVCVCLNQVNLFPDLELWPSLYHVMCIIFQSQDEYLSCGYMPCLYDNEMQ